MTNDDYVRRHEWEKSKGKFHERINEVDNKHVENYNHLLNTVDRQTLLQEKAFESQEKSEKHLENISESLTTVGTRVTELEYETRTHDKDIRGLQGTLAAETKGNRDVLLAWIGVAGVVLGPLVLWMANTFFK
ncbi:hypothetical protein CD110_04065 [Staphylococcus casei]|uniref:hypothetical protein n=1 Tax=Staphylococcus casei TaxID=201828 RepID=UPI000CD19A86|nr:hypothetical protein [Staphylococcus casei]PNZ60953.1 hypothetical protein CD110_04065 [Staphylococcus casei]WJE87442.1 hypothetical protein QMO72_05745 [Staphylococcus casei]